MSYRFRVLVGILGSCLMVFAACSSQIGDQVAKAPFQQQSVPTTVAGLSVGAVVLAPASADIRATDWASVPLPGEFCGVAGASVFDGRTVRSRTFGEAHLRVDPDVVEYGDLDGDRTAEAAVPVLCDNGGGTADGTLATGYVVVRTANGSLEALGAVIAQEVVPRGTNSTLVGGLRFIEGALEVEENFYRASDRTCCPTGFALTTWTYRNGTLTAGSPHITSPPVPERTVQDVLDIALRSWRSHDALTQRRFVQAGARKDLDRYLTGSTAARTLWSPGCSPGPSGSGECPVAVTTAGQMLTCRLSYYSADRSYRVTYMYCPAARSG